MVLKSVAWSGARVDDNGDWGWRVYVWQMEVIGQKKGARV